MPATIQVVEPTLVDEAGHCHSFLGAVAAAGPEERFLVWADRAVQPLFSDLPQVQLRPYFRRRWRRPQAYFLFRQLLPGEGRIFLPTAGRTDLALLDRAARGPIPEGKATLFFHWIRPAPSRLARLAGLARRQPRVRVLGATAEIVTLLREAGFADAREVPYPVTTRARPPQVPSGFRHVLFAGAARRDKGFARVVDWIEELARSGGAVPVAVQSSTRHYGKGDPAVAADIERLDAIGYSGLVRHAQTLDTASYLELFHGAICLQPYDRAEFAGRVSAVTVDALASGAPVITTAGTWMGRTVERLDAGLALEDLSAAALSRAVQHVIEAYPRYSENARKAALAIQEEHSGRHLLDAVLT